MTSSGIRKTIYRGFLSMKYDVDLSIIFKGIFSKDFTLLKPKDVVPLASLKSILAAYIPSPDI